MTQHLSRIWRRTEGTTAIEFAMIIPVFVMMIISTIVFGHAFYSMSTIQWAIEDTTRELMIDNTMSDAEFELRAQLMASQLTNIEFDVTFSDSLLGEIPVTEVTTVITYPINIPLYGKFDYVYTVETHAPRPL